MTNAAGEFRHVATTWRTRAQRVRPEHDPRLAEQTVFDRL
jgi:hypothetical protein